MIKKQRKGVALITVVLIAALLLMSIVGISVKVTSEKKTSLARASSARALTAAETGLSQVLFNLRNADFISGTTAPSPDLEYLTIEDVKSIVRNGVGHIVDCGDQEYPPGSTVPYVTYHVKVKRLPKGITDAWDPDSGSDGDKDVYVQVYSLGTIYRDSTKAEVLAKRVVTTECKVVYHKESHTTYGSTSGAFDYGLFSGTDITFNGNAQEVNGNIYAGGNIDLGHSPAKTRVENGEAYAHGQITGKGKTTGGNPQSGVKEIPFPQLNVDYYKDLAYKFKTGQSPYDGKPVYDEEGNKLYYANSNYDGKVLAAVQYYLGSDNTGNTVDEIQTFYDDLKNRTGNFGTFTDPEYSALWKYVKSIVYYINPAPGDGTGTASINGTFECQGTIVINGDLSINGGAEIDNGGGLAILVNGDIIRSNGNAELNGLFYATGGITGNGTFDCTGSIVTQDPIDLNGTFQVTYQEITMPNISIEGDTTVAENNIPTAEQSPSSWKEVSYDVFDGIH